MSAVVIDPAHHRTGNLALMVAIKKRAQKLEAKGKPVDFNELLGKEPDSGSTNIRNTSSAHWKRWLVPDHRCLAPFSGLAHKPKYLVQLHLSDRAANSALALVFSVGTA